MEIVSANNTVDFDKHVNAFSEKPHLKTSNTSPKKAYNVAFAPPPVKNLSQSEADPAKVDKNPYKHVNISQDTDQPATSKETPQKDDNTQHVELAIPQGEGHRSVSEEALTNNTTPHRDPPANLTKDRSTYVQENRSNVVTHRTNDDGYPDTGNRTHTEGSEDLKDTKSESKSGTNLHTTTSAIDELGTHPGGPPPPVPVPAPPTEDVQPDVAHTHPTQPADHPYSSVLALDDLSQSATANPKSDDSSSLTTETAFPSNENRPASDELQTNILLGSRKGSPGSGIDDDSL